MKRMDRHPPTLAIWLLDRFNHSVTKEAMIGDLIQRFAEGQSEIWFWKQVVLAVAASTANEIRSRWPAICYGVAAPALAPYLWRVFTATREKIPWQDLPWPWSQVVFEGTPAVLLPIAALPLLATALAISGAFRWISLFKTLMFGVLLSTAAHILLATIAVPQRVLWPRTDPWVLVAAVLNISILGGAFMLSASLGCNSPRGAVQRTAKRII
jgi:hypothetical protein